MRDPREGKTLRLPPELWRRVSERARENRRSTTREIEHTLFERYTATTTPRA